MRKVIMILMMLLMYATVPAQQLVSMVIPPAAVAKTNLRWEATEHNFGEIKQGVPVSATFSFTNTSNVPLLVKSVKGSCGCTVTSYTQESIAPGAQGQVMVAYNAAVPGAFYKTVRVSVNTQPEEIVLSLRGAVVAGEHE